jgi:hypothetical protein
MNPFILVSYPDPKSLVCGNQIDITIPSPEAFTDKGIRTFNFTLNPGGIDRSDYSATIILSGSRQLT